MTGWAIAAEAYIQAQLLGDGRVMWELVLMDPNIPRSDFRTLFCTSGLIVNMYVMLNHITTTWLVSWYHVPHSTNLTRYRYEYVTW